MDLLQRIQATFAERFSSPCSVFASPGRINFLGEHVDYNNGVVLPAAVDKEVLLAIAPNGTNRFVVYSLDFDETESFDATELRPGHRWVNYIMGVIAGLKERGLTPGGFNCVIGGNIPTGAGLSSSAALCCGVGFALNELFQLGHDRPAIALVAQYAEHEFAGVKCGLMDQYACLYGEPDAILALDCRTLLHRAIPVRLGNYEIVLVNSMVHHSLAATAYNDRRAACEKGVSILRNDFPGINSLRDARMEHLEQVKGRMDEDTYRKCRFVISEIDRVILGVKFLNVNDWLNFGQLMFETHRGLSKEYEVSCAEVDLLVALAREHKGVIGSRMMGGGFGGCSINLVDKSEVPSFIQDTRDKYVASFKKEPEFYLVKPSEGVHKIH